MKSVTAACEDPKAVRRQFTFWLDRRSGSPKGGAESAAGFAALSNDGELGSDLNRLDVDLYSRDSSETATASKAHLARIGTGVRDVRRATLVQMSSKGGRDPGDLPPLNPKQ